jgi:hypothetical protein
VSRRRGAVSFLKIEALEVRHWGMPDHRQPSCLVVGPRRWNVGWNAGMLEYVLYSMLDYL